MPLFLYKATQADGTVVKGSLEADSLKGAVVKLQGMQCIPMTVKAAKENGATGFLRSLGVSNFSRSIGTGVRTRDVMRFTLDLSALIRAGLPLDKSLRILEDTTENGHLKPVVGDILKTVQGGGYLSDALGKHPRIFSAFYVNMVSAGEAGGVLERVLERLGVFLENSQELKDYITSALIYPLFLVVVGMLICGIMRRKKLAKSFWPYILIGGGISWMGMHMAGIHPALSLVAIVPLLPSSGESVMHADEHGVADATGISALHKFEDGIGPIVDYGLFFFGLANAGVVFSSMSNLTWIIMIALIVGKTFGISLFTLISDKVMGFGLPEGMQSKEVPVAGIIAGMGLTVALFVTQSAYTDLATQGAAKMGAFFSVAAAFIAIIVGRLISIKRKTK